MPKRLHSTGIYAYLESSGALNGSEDRIIAARKEYIRRYKAQWRKNKRQREKEITTSWTNDELQTIRKEAKRHHSSHAEFIKSATKAYIDKSFVVPNADEVRRIAQLLAMTYNSLQEIIDGESVPSDLGKLLKNMILELEHTVLASLHNPKSLDEMIREAIRANEKQKVHIHQVLENIQ